MLLILDITSITQVTGHRWDNCFSSVLLPQSVGCEHNLWSKPYCKWKLRRMLLERIYVARAFFIGRAFAVLADLQENCTDWNSRGEGMWRSYAHCTAHLNWNLARMRAAGKVSPYELKESQIRQGKDHSSRKTALRLIIGIHTGDTCKISGANYNGCRTSISCSFLLVW
jgi:hypothetical protein